MPDTEQTIRTVRSSHERFVALVSPLSDTDLVSPSYAKEWTVADVASHLGSQAEIFGMFLDAGLSGMSAPGVEAFRPVWDRWNALSPRDQAEDSIAANEVFVDRLEQVSAVEREKFALALFGSDVDLAGLAAMRLSEHAVHTWDIAVALDPSAVLADDAVQLLMGAVGPTSGRLGRPADSGDPVRVTTTGPARRFVVTAHPEVTVTDEEEESGGTGTDGEPGSTQSVELPAEAFIRLLYGRLDPDHTPQHVTEGQPLALLRTLFPGV